MNEEIETTGEPVNVDTETKPTKEPETISENTKKDDGLKVALSEKNAKIQELKQKLAKIEKSFEKEQQERKTTDQRIAELEQATKQAKLEARIKDFTKDEILKSFILKSVNSIDEIEDFYNIFNQSFIVKSNFDKLLSQKDAEIEKLNKTIEKLKAGYPAIAKTPQAPVKPKQLTKNEFFLNKIKTARKG